VFVSGARQLKLDVLARKKQIRAGYKVSVTRMIEQANTIVAGDSTDVAAENKYTGEIGDHQIT